MKDASVCILLNAELKFLLLKRSPKSDWMPNKWYLVSGGIKSDESPEKAILREIKEETNLKPDIIKFKYSHFYNGTKVFIYTGIVKDFENLKINNEHTEFGWFTGKEIKKLDTVPDLIKIIFKGLLIEK